MDSDQLYKRYQELQRYVGWLEDDARRVQAIADLLAPYLTAIIDDFYAVIDEHPEAHKVITGGQAQIQRLKGTLLAWLRDLLSGPYERDYVVRRWKAGYRHVEIGLSQVYTNVALSRIRSSLLQALHSSWKGDAHALLTTAASLNRLLDLDLAIIEEAYQAENLLRQQRVERLATIGQVAGGVAHELRNPLNVVKTSVYYLLNAKNPSPAKTAEHLDRIERQVTLCDGVITALSSFAKMGPPHAQPFSLRECIREALEAGQLGNRIEVAVDLPATLPAAMADSDQIRIVFRNLISNARDAMPSGGKLAISGQHLDDHVEVAVQDSGVGIPKENLGRILEPLYSTKAKGLGLGLSLVRAILEKNHATLGVVSQLGQGSTFTVRLRAAP